MLEKNQYEELLAEMKLKKDQGLPDSEVLSELSKDNVSLVDALHIAKDLLTGSSVKAKELLLNHAQWREIVLSYDRFHEDLSNELQRENDKHK